LYLPKRHARGEQHTNGAGISAHAGAYSSMEALLSSTGECPESIP
jgi:hypothetical protein